MRSSRGALGVARNRFVCEQLQLQALFGCSFWLLPAFRAIETLAIGGSLDQLLDYVAGGDQAAARVLDAAAAQTVIDVRWDYRFRKSSNPQMSSPMRVSCSH